MTLDLTALRNALASLEAGLDVVGDATWFDRQPEKVRNTLVAGVIQNFELVYEGTLRFVVDARDLLRRLEARNV